MSSTLFISDLHLDDQEPAVISLFERFCAEVAPGARALYILGDLFEMWVGDDVTHAASRAVSHELSQLASQGTNCYLMHGNRDFLLGQTFADDCQATLISDPFVINTPSGPCVLCHGDELNTADEQYMQLRAQLRSPQFARDALSLPKEQRIETGRAMRAQSISENRNKPDHIMDVTAEAVDAMLDVHHAQLMIHGHTHRPAVHRWQHKGHECERIVLGMWEESGTHYARLDTSGAVQLLAWPQ